MSASQISNRNPKTENDQKKDDCSTVLKIESLKHQEYVDQDDLTLEKVVRDMAHVLYNLKSGVKLVKKAHGTESGSDVENEINKTYQNQKETRKRKIEEEKSKNQNKTQARRKCPSNGGANKRKIQNKSKIQPNNLNSSKIIVTTVKFPSDKNAKPINSSLAATKNSTERTQPCPQPTLRKPLPDTSKRALSVPPPREVYNPLGILKDEVERAKRDCKTFTIKGSFGAVRRALLKRGWVEKFHTGYREKIADDIRKFQQLSIGELVDLLRNKEIAQTCKKLIKSKLLKDYQVDLYWDHTFDAFKECPDTKKLTLINRFRRESFSYTSKQGLCQAAREAYWLHIPGVARINHPRSYILTKGGDTKSFVKDFGLTAAISLLKWVVKNNITGECKVVSLSGKIPMKMFDFAITECYKFVKKQKHEDIDEEITEAIEQEWNEFLEQYYKAVHIGNHFKIPDKNEDPFQVAKDMVRKANYLLNELREHLPCLDMDGYMNIWILKPTNGSRGIGIHICRTLQYILDIIKKNPNRRYVIQKYIERPLLIHETKFDIRQWFLVSSSYPLTIWIYNQCYLRFSCQTYNLRKLHESIHLTNNSVQSRYTKTVSRDPLLPAYGMWDSKQFKAYLSDMGYPTIFAEVIYPGMKQCITGAMIAHRDKIDKRKNCFELYGADFMLAENFDPWLLEINSNPALHASTPVTARMCPEVLEDVIKVVVDHARNNKSNTGHFEMIYRENLQHQTVNTSENLKITGTPVPEDYFCDDLFDGGTQKRSQAPQKLETPDPACFLLQTGQTMKVALKNLLEIVKREKKKRHARKEKCIETKSSCDISACTQTCSELVSLYENAVSKKDSGHSQDLFDAVVQISREELSQDESKRITEVLNEITSLQNKKQLLSGLVKVVNALKNK